MTKIPRLLPLIAIAIGGVVAVRAVGAGPGLFEGAKAWAEDATSAVSTPASSEPAKTPPAVCALTPEQLAQQAGISPAELRIIQSLSTRRKELDARDTSFETTLPLMVAAEQKLDGKIQALNAIKAEVQGLLGQVNEKAKAENDRLVAVYSAMRPREAAAVFNTLSDDVRLPVAAAMRPRGLAAIMAQMPPVKAQELTEKLARRFQAQQLAARAAVAGAAEPAPTATPAQAPAAAPTPTSSAATSTATPAATPSATPTAAPTHAATRPAARPAARPTRPATRPAARPATTPTSSAQSGPQPYAASGNAAAAPSSTAPRQSVQ